MKSLPEIPYVDLRAQSLSDLVQGRKQQVIDLINSIKGLKGDFMRVAGKPGFVITDKLSKNWLKKSANPYLDEIERYQDILGISGVYTLNLCYEWGCTTSVIDTKDGPVMTRVLDWPFPAMDDAMVVAHQRGQAGEFYNVTWPGMAGVFNAVAENRFAAALNQAPMRRRRGFKLGDWFQNRVALNNNRHLPPAHLLRKVMENATTYEEAKKMLVETPIAIPVIFTLAGTKPGEGCVIERTETKAAVREMKNGRVSVSNHFQSGLAHDSKWQARRDCSYPRATAGNKIDVKDLDDNFSWFTAPIANEYSRLAMHATAATGKFSLVGTDGPRKTTKTFRR